MGPDARVLVLKSRKQAVQYARQFGHPPPVITVVKDLAKVMQEYTQSGGVRPFGVSLLVIGRDGDHQTALYQVDPSGAYFAWSATAIGKNSQNVRSFLEKRYVAVTDTENLFEIEDAIHLGLLGLKEVFEGKMDATNVQVAVVDAKGEFRILTEAELIDYTAGL